MPRLTISSLPEDVKREYVKWCVDHTKGNVSLAIYLFIKWIVARTPTMLDIYDTLNIVFDDELERGPEAGEGDDD